MDNFNGSLKAVDCHIDSVIYMIIGLVLWCELQESLSVSHLVTYEIVLAVADTRASALAVKGYFFGRNTSDFVAFLTLL